MIKGFTENNYKGLVYYTIPLFEETGLVKHCFTSRLGGISDGECSSLNLGFNKKDTRQNVLENFERICEAMDICTQDLVLSDQIHDDHIKYVTEKDRGKGIFNPKDYSGVDALITDKKGIALVTFYADCVPLFILDQKQKAIGLAHAGWKGTLKRIGQKTLGKMMELFQTRPKDCLVGIGPSIGKCCFEVDNHIASLFKGEFGDLDVIDRKSSQKCNIDLWTINANQFVEKGVLPSNIIGAKICTKCNKDIFFSHRGDKGKTGSLAAFMQLI
ncbi:MAG: peptidoglycan editing factor PgeF [Clostridia bacterium]|nr:peptidoglycan editing factor PgeF [Clostridia bacterium]